MFENRWSWLLLILLVLSGFNSLGQTSGLLQNNFGPIDDRLIVETKWRYTYALHVESNTILHKAEDYYKFFLFFRYDYSYEQFLNSKWSTGNWSLHKRTLFYAFKNINKFEITDLTKKKMVLEFKQPNAKGTYQYHFIRVETRDAPFKRRWNELPEVNVEAKINRKKKEKIPWWAFGRKKRLKEMKAKHKEKETYINVELIGGGYYGGIDPVLRDFIRIKSNGRLVKEFKSIKRGLIVHKKNISRNELEEFVEYVKQQGFFEMDRMYNCETEICQKRKSKKPTPIPLRLAITYGLQKKVITIGIWGKDEHNIKYVEYPPELDVIIKEIQKMGHRL